MQMYGNFEGFPKYAASRWWFQTIYFFFIPIPGEIIQFDDFIFSNGLKPPTSIGLSSFPVIVSSWSEMVSPTKHVVMRVVTMTEIGDNPM